MDEYEAAASQCAATAHDLRLAVALGYKLPAAVDLSARGVLHVALRALA